MFTREQCKAARAVRGWGVRELALATERRFGPGEGVAFTSISRFENGADARGETLRKLQATLEAEGFEFLNTGRPGVRWDADTPPSWDAASPEGNR